MLVGKVLDGLIGRIGAVRVLQPTLANLPRLLGAGIVHTVATVGAKTRRTGGAIPGRIVLGMFRPPTSNFAVLKFGQVRNEVVPELWVEQVLLEGGSVTPLAGLFDQAGRRCGSGRLRLSLAQLSVLLPSCSDPSLFGSKTHRVQLRWNALVGFPRATKFGGPVFGFRKISVLVFQPSDAVEVLIEATLLVDESLPRRKVANDIHHLEIPILFLTLGGDRVVPLVFSPKLMFLSLVVDKIWACEGGIVKSLLDIHRGIQPPFVEAELFLDGWSVLVEPFLELGCPPRDRVLAGGALAVHLLEQE
mmetsp:Transcript_70998/g.148523  ORF Transcript_70998/g.148523 Transcript_70998/m.148523 type:complete len:304 (+) Transcript_70998:810-1721(+)